MTARRHAPSRPCGFPAGLLCCTLLAALAGCQVEKRDLGPSAPLTAPTDAADPRARVFETNRYQMSEGARVFRWAGCGGCHTERAPSRLNLADQVWVQGGDTVAIYRTIADGAPGMPAMRDRLSSQQIWQVAGYLHGLPDVRREQRRRSELSLAGEPRGQVWKGALP